MPNQPPIVREHVSPAFKAFIEEVRASGSVAELTDTIMTANGTTGGLSTARRHRRSRIRYVEQVLRGTVGHPNPDVAWEAGEAARRLGTDWASGPLFLFAAGHFARFAEVMCRATAGALTAERKAALIGAIRTACEPTVRATEESVRAQALADGRNDLEIQAILRDFRALGRADERSDRPTATLTLHERAAFRAAIAQSDELPDASAVVVSMCKFAEEAAGGIVHQRKIAATALWHHFVSEGPGW